MSQFASCIKENEIREQAVPQIAWGTIIVIMKKCSSHKEMLWYINETHKHGWSRAMVMNQIAKEFSFNEISQQLVGQIPWGTLVTVIMPKSYSHEEMIWYINETHKNGWSRSMVLNQIALKAYERNLIEATSSISIKSDDSINEIFKDTYVFDFLDKNEIKTEKDLKKHKKEHLVFLFLG